MENFAPEPGRDLGPLIHALRRNGGTLTFAQWVTQWVTVPHSMTVDLHLPDDPERAEKCCAAIDEWRNGLPLAQTAAAFPRSGLRPSSR